MTRITKKRMMSDEFTIDELLVLLQEIIDNPRSLEYVEKELLYSASATRRITTLCRAIMQKREEERNHVRSDS